MKNAGAFDVTPVYKKIEDGKLVDGTETDGELVGWTIALKTEHSYPKRSYYHIRLEHY